MKKVLSLLLAVVMVISVFSVVPISAAENEVVTTSTQSKSGNFYTNYTLTGNGATDMVNIAMAQNERNQPSMGYTENWCADFVSDCAKLAEQSSAVPFNGAVNSMYTAVINAGGTRVSTAQAGDLVFFYNSSESQLGHVGIALDSSRNISGNIFYLGASPSKVCILKNSSEGYNHWFYVRPNYKNNTHTHNYSTYVYYEAVHPHYKCYKCSCGAVQANTSQTTTDDNCVQCLSPVVLGDKFVAYIINSAVNKNVTATSTNNVEMQYKNDSDSQKWLFELQSDNSYLITNVGYQKCMDVYCALTTAGTNIQIYDKNSSDAQRFYLKINDSGYSIVPKINTSMALDVTGGSYENGANIQQWNLSLGNKAQMFTIDYVDLNPSETQIYNGNTYEYYDLGMPWVQAYKFCEKQGGHLVTISSKEENDFVLDIANNYNNLYCWLGATTLGRDRNFYWVKDEPFTYTNWNTSEPSNTDNKEYYVEMYVNTLNVGTWNDSANSPMSHTKTSGFICEYENSVDADIYTPTKTFEYKNKKYEIYDVTVDWRTAQLICETKGGHLVTFSDVAENGAVFDAIQDCSKDSYWLGYTDIASEGDWRGVDTPDDTLSYANWKVGEPGNGSNCEDYAFMLKSSNVWEDLKGFSYGYHNIGFICEYENEKNNFILGDVDGDGIVSVMDATALQQHLANISTLSDLSLEFADTDKDGIISVMDATQIQRFVAQLITEF